jgi:hypothetical protein
MTDSHFVNDLSSYGLVFAVNEKLNPIVSGNSGARVAPRDIFNCAGTSYIKLAGITRDETDVTLSEALHDPPAKKRLKIPEADVIVRPASRLSTVMHSSALSSNEK